MDKSRGCVRWTGRLAGLACGLAVVAAANAQSAVEDFPTGSAAAAWAKWQPAMQAILDRTPEQVERSFGELLALEPSALRVALLADRTVSRTAHGGALLLLEQDHENKALGPNGQQIGQRLEQGREQLNEADDGWYFCSVGRFDIAEANFRALLGSDPDPVALLEFTDRVPRRRDLLLQLTDHSLVGERVRALLKLLDRGEELVKADPTRIRTRIEGLGGPPRAYENSVALLQQSGEYAVPFLIEYLRDPAQKSVTQAILRCLPKIDRPALNPLAIAVRMNDTVVQGYLVEALGKIGYPQALPYLLQLREKPDLPPELAATIEEALRALEARGVELPAGLRAAEAFYRLAVGYYEDQPSLAADPRLDTANVWYWRHDLLENVAVPTQIFNEIMCLRGCEEALRLEPTLKKAQALWIAANFRRTAQLGEGQVDRTRPENYPSAAYFAQTGGAEVCLMALARAVADGDPAVALGAIEALHNTAGPASVVREEGRELPLANALSFPDRMVRVRAALTLGQARPTQPFHNYQNLMPVLEEALLLFKGGRSALVVDPDATVANQVAAVLRADGYEVITDAEFLRGLQKVREEFSALDVICVSSTLPDVPLAEALKQLRSEFRFAATPVVVISKPGDHDLVSGLARADHRLGEIQPSDSPDRIRAAVQQVSRAVGVTPISAEVGTALALEAAEVHRLLAITNNPLFAVADAERALVAAIDSREATLRLTAADVLGYLPTTAAQEAIAKIALNTDEPAEMRVKMFAALAEAAKHGGNHLGQASVARLVSLAEKEPDLVIRTAASQVVGALNLAGDKGSEIIRNQYGG